MTPYIFFTGKGGVGKTTIACARAVQLAIQGKRVLLISTDPASNLSDVLDTPVGEVIVAHRELQTLDVVNINPEVAAEEYRKRVISPLEGSMSAEEIQVVRESLSGACTTEIASFDEFARFITGEDLGIKYDCVIFDTAPTGHTLRLLELPAAWDEFITSNPSGASCLGPSSALKSSRDRYHTVLNRLRDPALTTIYLVARPDAHSLREAARTSTELISQGLHNQELILNGIFHPLDKSDLVALKLGHLSELALAHLADELKVLKHEVFPLLPYNVLGVQKLLSLFDLSLQRSIALSELSLQPNEWVTFPGIAQMTTEISRGAKNGLIMTMGKGGVGKTLVASAVAVLLARQGHTVLLTTTDPAAHIHDFINQLPELPPTLSIEHIDPKTETQHYIDKVMAQKGKTLDDEGRKLLLEDLRSPCTEEVAVFHAFSKAIQKSRRQFVVMDTAPTGHTLLLLDTTGSYHREVLRNTSLDPNRITTPFMALQDATLTRILLVSLPEITPMHEATALQDDLKRAGITPWAWVINQCLSAVKDLRDPLLRRRAAAEESVIANISGHLAQRTFAIPLLPEEKVLPELLGLEAVIKVGSENPEDKH